MLKVFSHYFPTHTLQQALVDACLLFVSALVAIGFHVHWRQFDWPLIVPSALAFAVVMVLLNSVIGLYRAPAGPGTPGRTFVRIGIAIVVSVPVALGIFWVLPWNQVASEAVQISIVLLLGAVLAARGFVNRTRSTAMFAPRVLIIGTGADALAVERCLAGPQQEDGHVVGFYSAGSDDALSVNPRRVLDSDGGLLETVRRHKVDEVIVAVRERRGGVLPIRDLLDCKLRGVRVVDLSSFFERTQGQVRIDSLRASWLIYGDGFRQGWARTCVKRAFDLIAASLLLLFSLPVMLVTAILILLEDGAPIFYRQERVGLGGRTFRVIKFRSMRRDAEKDGRPRWATSNDSRTTRVGRVIRRLRIDELPQLLNVLAGDMSLVGPRPERPYFVDQLGQEIPFYSVRHCVKPGVTGWAQVRYQYGSSVDDAVQKLQYDLYYVKNHTLILDTLVLFETVRVVLTGEGAQ